MVLVAAVAAFSGNMHSVMLGGDVMLNGISTSQKPFAKVGALLKPAGTAILNLEIPLTNARSSTPFKSAADLKARNQYILKADPNHAPGLAGAGVDLVSLGNNHCMDYREAGMKQMKSVLDKWQVGYTGAGANQDEAMALRVYTNASGQRVGLLSALAFMNAGGLGKCTPATDKRAGVGTLSFGGKIDDAAKKYLAAWIAPAKKQCDLLVVGLHWGIEKQTVPTGYQVALGRACVESGADIVWGNHPHVLQGAEVYKGKPILYSMGNFVAPRGGNTGLVKLVYDGQTFQKALFYPCSIVNGQVRPVYGKEGQSRVKSFAGLCTTMARTYLSKDSRPMFGNLVRAKKK